MYKNFKKSSLFLDSGMSWTMEGESGYGQKFMVGFLPAFVLIDEKGKLAVYYGVLPEIEQWLKKTVILIFVTEAYEIYL